MYHSFNSGDRLLVHTLGTTMIIPANSSIYYLGTTMIQPADSSIYYLGTIMIKPADSSIYYLGTITKSPGWEYHNIIWGTTFYIGISAFW